MIGRDADMGRMGSAGDVKKTRRRRSRCWTRSSGTAASQTRAASGNHLERRLQLLGELGPVEAVGAVEGKLALVLHGELELPEESIKRGLSRLPGGLVLRQVRFKVRPQ